MSTFVCSHPLSRVYDVFTFTTNAEHFSSVGQMVAESTALSSPPLMLSRRAGRRETCPIVRPFMVCALMSCRAASQLYLIRITERG